MILFSKTQGKFDWWVDEGLDRWPELPWATIPGNILFTTKAGSLPNFPVQTWTSRTLNTPQGGLLHSSGNPQQGRFIKPFRRKVTGNYSVQLWGFCQTKSHHSACKACLSISNWQLMIQQSLQSLGLCIWLSHYDAIFQGKLIHLLFWVQGLVLK